MSKTKKIISVVLAAVLVMAMATVAIVSSSALEDGEMHVVAGAAELCGSAWDPADSNNQMTFNADKGIYEKVYENVAAGTYEFKVTTNGAWDVADFNLEGDARYGGPNASVTVDTDGSTVIVGFDGSKALVEVVAGSAPVTTTAAPVVTTTAAPVVTTTAAPVVTTVATDPSEVTTTVATVDESTAATDPSEATTAATDPSEVTTAATDPSEVTTAATEPEVTTTTAAVVENDVIVVAGTEYTAKVGDTVTYTATLKTPNLIEDVQGYVTYDASKLTVVECNVPQLGDSAIVNIDEPGVVYFNASVVKGIDFTAEATLVEIKFTVADTAYSEIALTIEEMTEKDGGSYFTDSQQVNADVAITETLAVPQEATTTTTEPVGTTTTVVVPTEDKTDATSKTDAPAVEDDDVPKTGATVAIYAVLATLAMAAAAVVVLRKKVNG